MLWFIDLTVAMCYIQLHFSEFTSRENGQDIKILKVRHFRMITKMATDSYRESLLRADLCTYLCTKSNKDTNWN